MNHFEKLASINVNDRIEKKGNLSYLSWAWAVDQLLRQDPQAVWEYKEPARWGETVMVFCAVTAFGVTRTAQLPVMDHRNKAISNPDAFQVNTAMQRALAKAIALHGLGLYIYAGEDLPNDIDNSGDGLTHDQRNKIADLCCVLTDAYQADCDVFTEYEQITDNEEKLYLWSMLDSKIRSTLKAYDAIMQASSMEGLRAAWEAAPKHAHTRLEQAKEFKKSVLTKKEAA